MDRIGGDGSGDANISRKGDNERRERREKHLQEQIKKMLQANGELNKIRSALRLQVLNVFRDTNDVSLTNFSSNRWTTFDLINSLILEYFQWMSFNFSAEIFAAEIGQCDEKSLSRNEMEEKIEAIAVDEVHFVKHVPLLLNVLNKIISIDD